MSTEYKICIFESEGNPTLASLAKGIAKHDQVKVYKQAGDLQGCDVAVCWSMKKRGFIAEAKKLNIPLLIAECGYLGDRGKNDRSLGWNGINGDADFCNQDVPNDRAQRWLPQMKPWKKRGDYILLCGQVIGDYSLLRLHQKLHVFYSMVYKQLLKEYKIPVIFRSHPLWDCTQLPEWVVKSKNKTIEEDLENAWMTVAWSSNSLVDSIMSGTPTLALDPMSMVWDISIHNIGKTPRLPDRQEWLNKLSYCQWTLEEFESGKAWLHVRKYLERTENG